MFPNLSDAKVKGHIFSGSQIRVMLASLQQKITEDERNAWESFRAVVTSFLDHRRDNYKEIMDFLIEHYRLLGLQNVSEIVFLTLSSRIFSAKFGESE